MQSPDVRIARLAERQHSVLSGEQARSCGLSQDQIDYRVSSGLLLRLHRAVYRVPGSKLTEEGAVLAAILAAGDGAVASCITAARVFGVEILDGKKPHISV